MNNKTIPILIAICLIICAATTSFACGPFFPESVITDGDEQRVLDLPNLAFYQELQRISGVNGDSSDLLPTWPITIDADAADLAKALKESKTPEGDIRSITAEYRKMRDAMKVWSDGYITADLDFGESRQTSSTVQSLNLAPYEPLLAKLPQEFQLYVRGAAAWRGDDFDKAIAAWQQILNLPKERRRHKSTWAAFMIGKCYLQSDPVKATEWLEKTRQLAAEGYMDSLDLAANSWGWQAMIDMRNDKPVEAVKKYLEMFKTTPRCRNAAFLSLRMIFEDRKSNHPHSPDARLAADPLTRQIVTAFFIARWFSFGGTPSDAWLKKVQATGQRISGDEAERLASLAYGSGNMQQAEEWLNQSSSLGAYGKWVLAKIRLREGKIDEAVRLLSEAKTGFPQADDSSNQIAASNQLQMDQATLLLGRRGYTEAMDLFIRADHWWDAAYIAERVWTPEELKRYIEKHKDDPNSAQKIFTRGYGTVNSPTDLLSSLLSRRYARLGNFSMAEKYCSEKWKPTLTEYVTELQAGHDAKQPARTRAEHLMKAATIARNHGMEIMGTELEPDWAAVDGDFHVWHRFYGEETYNRRGSGLDDPGAGYSPRRIIGYWAPYHMTNLNPVLRQVLDASPDEKTRFTKSESKPYRFLHYRYTAANLMWEAAKLLPDNDPLTAQALYDGGMYIQYRDKQAADRFYKALVRRCRKLPIGQKADKLRWFPDADNR